MRVVLLGAGGQLAHDLRQALTDFQVLAWTRAELDLTDFESVERRLSEARPDFVVNAAAYNLVDQAEKEPEVAFAGNALGPRNVAKVCGAVDATLVHFSTDYVFGLDAARETPWLESDAPGPVSAYGASK